MNTEVSGRAYCCGSNVSVYQVIPEKRWTMKTLDGEAMSNWVFEDLEENAKDNKGYFLKLGFQIVVAGKQFGCGSKSVEQPMAALKAAGIKLVIAESFSRYSYRNAINLGMPVIVCPGITQYVKHNDILSVDLLTGRVCINNEIVVQGEPISEFGLGIISAGGLIGYLNRKDDNNE